MEFEKPSDEVSSRMRRVKSKGTNLERRMEAILKGLSLEYEIQPKMVGHPDFRLKGTRMLVFCDSSFWHGRREDDLSGLTFRRNREFWTRKLKYNRERDRRINRLLRSEGWIVLRFWDTDITRDPEKVARQIRRRLNAED